jgi:hypothetical protein
VSRSRQAEGGSYLLCQGVAEGIVSDHARLLCDQGGTYGSVDGNFVAVSNDILHVERDGGMKELLLCPLTATRRPGSR